MCGILGYFGNKKTKKSVLERRNHFLKLSKKIRHRGPDWNGVYFNGNTNVFIGHERLSIVGVETGSQPLTTTTSTGGELVLSVNGEIYNHKELMSSVLHSKYINKSGSDCEVLLYLYQEYGHTCVKMLDGIFSFILYDTENDSLLIARDPIGVTSLYYGITADCELMVSSEFKCLTEDCVSINMFPPGSYTYVTNVSSREKSLEDINFVKYYSPSWKTSILQEFSSNDEAKVSAELVNRLTNAVEKRLMCDVPFGVLLSGGLDSSLIASITSRSLKTNERSNFGNKLHSFSIGLPESPDLVAARKVAIFLGTIHHEFTFTIQEGLDVLYDLIYHLETYDITTIRASTPMYLLSRKIKSLGIKMVLSGEGADEILGGYLYFHQAPNDNEFHEECKRRVNMLHHFDCLRANKSTMAWGVEIRVPFLDQSFMEYAMQVHPKFKLNKIEKYILRKAFDTPNNPYLPDEILWRQKEQFSDGVGYSWVDSLIDKANKMYTDEELLEAQKYYSDDPPKTKEALMYRKMYSEIFTEKVKVPTVRWIPQMNWDNVSYDPSGRAQNVHSNVTEALK